MERTRGTSSPSGSQTGAAAKSLGPGGPGSGGLKPEKSCGCHALRGRLGWSHHTLRTLVKSFSWHTCTPTSHRAPHWWGCRGRQGESADGALAELPHLMDVGFYAPQSGWSFRS